MVGRRAVLAALFIGLAAASFGGAGAAAAERVKVVASFSIIADLVRQVGGEAVDVAALVGPDGDAHVFSPSPHDAKTLAAARLIVVNGLKLEGWMDRLIKASGAKAPTIVASQGIEPIAMKSNDRGHADDHVALDPHAWQSVSNAMRYAVNIRDGLIAVDPAGQATYAANAAAYLAKLEALDADVRAAIAAIPAERRKIITSHDAFGYFGKTYGLDFVAPQGVSTEAEASARDVARIIRQIKAQRIPAVFLENISDTRLIERIAKETGAKIGGKIYSDALSAPPGPAGTYIDMMRANIRAFSVALSS